MNKVMEPKPADEIAAWLLERLGPAPSLRSLLGVESGAAYPSGEHRQSGPRALREEMFSPEVLNKGATQ